jgi:DNA-binding transcriptional MerR regulator
MSEHYRIGEFAELGGVSRKTLRFYDEIGLLRPASVDVRTGYRGYEPQQLQELAAIAALKQLGLTLSEIRNAITRPGRNERRRMLQNVKAALESSMADAARLLTQVDAALAEIGCTSRTVPVVVRRHPGICVASVRSRVKTYADILPLEQELLRGLPEASVSTLRGVLWHRCADSGVLEGEPFVQLRSTLPRRSFYDVKELPAMTAACAYSRNDETDAEFAFDALKRWMATSGHALAGPKREIYRADEVLEIQFPLQS